MTELCTQTIGPPFWLPPTQEPTTAESVFVPDFFTHAESVNRVS